MEENNLDWEALIVPEDDGTEGGWFFAHMRETHDIWHVATGFGTDVAGELGLQAFYLAQLKAPLSTLLLSVGMLNTFLYAMDDRDWRMRNIVRGWLMGKEGPLLRRLRLGRPLGHPSARAPQDAPDRHRGHRRQAPGPRAPLRARRRRLRAGLRRLILLARLPRSGRMNPHSFLERAEAGEENVVRGGAQALPRRGPGLLQGGGGAPPGALAGGGDRRPRGLDQGGRGGPPLPLARGGVRGRRGRLPPLGDRPGGGGALLRERLRHGLHSDIIVPYLHEFGTAEQKKRWLPGCASGERITAIAMTEPGTGSDLAAVATTATRDGDEYVLNGAKTFISNGILCDLCVVVAKTNNAPDDPHRSISLFVVEADRPGFHKGKKLKKMGMASQDTAELSFEDCRIPASNLLGEEGMGFFMLMQKLQQERLVVAIGAQAMAEQVLEDTVQYTQERKAFGRPISKFQNTRFKLVDCATEVEIGRAFLDKLVAQHVAGSTWLKSARWPSSGRRRWPSGSSTSAFSSSAATATCLEYPISRAYMDARVQRIYAGHQRDHEGDHRQTDGTLRPSSLRWARADRRIRLRDPP